jgi:hypothetical protein
MKIDKIKIKELIKSVRDFNGYLELNYVPSSTLKSTEELASLYYSGARKISLGECYHNGREFVDITESNIDEIVDKVYNTLMDNITYEINQALENLELGDTYIKYFDREPEMYNKFQKEVLRLKELKNEN